MELTIGLKAIGAGIAVIGMMGSGVGIGILAGKYFEAIARQPEVEEKLSGNFMVALGFAEAIALFAFAIAALIIFVL